MSGEFGPLARAARAIIRRTVWDSEAGDALDNLDAIYADRVRTRGRAAADAWYLGQALTFGPRLWLDPRGRKGGNGPRDRSLLAVWLDEIRCDVRYALRAFRRAPTFAVATVATLTLGVAATTVIYTVVRGVVLRPPPFPDPDRLVWVWPEDELAPTHATFVELDRRVAAGEMTAFAGRTFAIQGTDRPDEVAGVAVATDHFRVLGRPPVMGRAFSDEDGQPGREPVAIISHELWQSHFGADPSVVGRRVGLFTSAAIPMIPGAFTGTPHTVIGVLPPAYRPFGYPADVVTPLVADPEDPAFTNMGELRLLARLGPSGSAEGLREELVAAARDVPQLEPAMEEIGAATVVSLHEALTGHVRPALLITFGAVGLVLLIACANVANLMLARSHDRVGEIRVRVALGAGRRRIARQLLTECAVLAVAATALGTAAAAAALPAIAPLLPSELGIARDALGLDALVLGLAVALIAITLVVAGLLPAVRATARDAPAVVATRGGIGRTRRGNRVSHAIVVGELALAAMLASGAGLLMKSFVRLTEVDTGFDAADVMTVRIAPSAERYADTGVRRALVGRILEEVRGLPAIRSAGAIHFLPIADGGPGLNFLQDPTDPESRQSTGYRVITPGYLETMGVTVLRGRDISETDGTGDPPVGLVNRTLAERLWPGENAIGKRLYRTSGREWFTVVGVANDVRQAAMGLPPNPEAYVPLAQTEWASAMTIVARGPGSGPSLGAELERIVWSVDADVPVTRTAAMEDLLRTAVAGPRFYGVLFSLFAVLALLLGAIGIYGVASFVVRQRTDEIGIRIALGATGRGILVREIGLASRIAAIGIALGLAGAFACSRLLAGLLYEVRPIDPGVFAAAAAVLGVVALGAAMGPARRAARVDPLDAIRGD